MVSLKSRITAIVNSLTHLILHLKYSKCSYDNKVTFVLNCMTLIYKSVPCACSVIPGYFPNRKLIYIRTAELEV